MDLCGVDLKSFEEDVVRQGEPEVRFLGYYNFTSIEVRDNVQTTFLGDIPVESILLRNGDSDIECRMKFFGNVKVDGDIAADKINEVSPEDLAAMYQQKDGNTHHIDGDFYLDRVDVSNLTVRGSIQQKYLDSYLSSLIRVDDEYLKFEAAKTFSSPVILKTDVVAKYYNGIDMSDFKVFRISDNFRFTGPIEFIGPVYLPRLDVSHGQIEANRIESVDWKDLIENTIRTDSELGPETLSHLQFDRIMVEIFMHVETFQGRPFKDFIRLDSEDPIHYLKVNKMKFYGPDLEVGGRVMGYNLSQEYEDTFMVIYWHQFYTER
jgi:hypothetical protein